MSPRHLAALVVCLSLLVAIPVAVDAKTSHAGWPRINGKFRKDSHDRNKTYYGTARQRLRCVALQPQFRLADFRQLDQPDPGRTDV